MAARVLLLVVALTVGGYAVLQRVDVDACAASRLTVFNIGVQGKGPGTPSRSQAQDAVTDLREDCEDADAYVAGTQAMVFAGHPELAVGLARTAATKQPRDVNAWRALAAAARADGDDRTARIAGRRAARLNPLGGGAR